MKYLLFTTVFAALIFACSSREKNTSHIAVVKLITENLGEPGSYEPIEWDTIRPIYLRKDKTKSYLAIQDSITKIHEQSMADLKSKKIDFNAYVILMDSVKNFQRTHAKEGEGYDSSVITGYIIGHKYRAKNKHGALEVFDQSFGLSIKKDSAFYLF